MELVMTVLTIIQHILWIFGGLLFIGASYNCIVFFIDKRRLLKELDEARRRVDTDILREANRIQKQHNIRGKRYELRD